MNLFNIGDIIAKRLGKGGFLKIVNIVQKGNHFEYELEDGSTFKENSIKKIKDYKRPKKTK